MIRIIISICVSCLVISFTENAIDPVIKSVFYNLPIEKSRKELREIILKEPRFILKDTASNISKISTPYYLGHTKDHGYLQSKPDSIQIQIVSGTTTLTTEKEGNPGFKNVMILTCKYFFSSRDTVALESERLITKLQHILKDSSSTSFESDFSKDDVSGQIKSTGKLFENYNPYFSVEIISVEIIPEKSSKSTYGLFIEFRKVDS